MAESTFSGQRTFANMAKDVFSRVSGAVSGFVSGIRSGVAATQVPGAEQEVAGAEASDVGGAERVQRHRELREQYGDYFGRGSGGVGGYRPGSEPDVDSLHGFGQEFGRRVVDAATGVRDRVLHSFDNVRNNFPAYVDNLKEWFDNSAFNEPDVRNEARAAGLHPIEYKAGLAGMSVGEYTCRRAFTQACLSPLMLFRDRQSVMEHAESYAVSVTTAGIDYFSGLHGCTPERYVEVADRNVENVMGDLYGSRNRELADWGIAADADGAEVASQATRVADWSEPAPQAEAEDAFETFVTLPVVRGSVEPVADEPGVYDARVVTGAGPVGVRFSGNVRTDSPDTVTVDAAATMLWDSKEGVPSFAFVGDALDRNVSGSFADEFFESRSHRFGTSEKTVEMPYDCIVGHADGRRVAHSSIVGIPMTVSYDAGADVDARAAGMLSLDKGADVELSLPSLGLSAKGSADDMLDIDVETTPLGVVWYGGMDADEVEVAPSKEASREASEGLAEEVPETEPAGPARGVLAPCAGIEPDPSDPTGRYRVSAIVAGHVVPLSVAVGEVDMGMGGGTFLVAEDAEVRFEGPDGNEVSMTMGEAYDRDVPGSLRSVAGPAPNWEYDRIDEPGFVGLDYDYAVVDMDNPNVAEVHMDVDGHDAVLSFGGGTAGHHFDGSKVWLSTETPHDLVLSGDLWEESESMPYADDLVSYGRRDSIVGAAYLAEESRPFTNGPVVFATGMQRDPKAPNDRYLVDFEVGGNPVTMSVDRFALKRDKGDPDMIHIRDDADLVMSGPLFGGERQMSASEVFDPANPDSVQARSDAAFAKSEAKASFVPRPAVSSVKSTEVDGLDKEADDKGPGLGDRLPEV